MNTAKKIRKEAIEEAIVILKDYFSNREGNSPITLDEIEISVDEIIHLFKTKILI